MSELVQAIPDEATRDESVWTPPALGAWYWFANEGTPALVCVVALGSNYAKIKNVDGGSWRVHFDNFNAECTFEPNPSAYIRQKIDTHQSNVRGLLREIQRVTAQLGITPRDVLPTAADDTSNALATTSGTANVKAHQAALVRAKEKTLPDLFKRVESEHEELATWMKAELIPMLAEAKRAEGLIELVQDRILTVELYAGLVEEIEKIQDGTPAPNDTPIHLFQRRHYMDEECLVNYRAGGMTFEHIDAFDQWLLEPENLARILPVPRCVVAFKVRRERRRYRGANNIASFIRFILEGDADETTFLYLRNGDQVFRLATKIDFDEQLFPDIDHNLLFNQQAAWIDADRTPVSQATYEARWEAYHKARKLEAIRLRAWKRAGSPSGQWQYDEKACAEFNALGHIDERRTIIVNASIIPQGFNYGRPWGNGAGKPHLVPMTTDSVYYDDAMGKIAEATKAHNRIAVVLQGLLDRSPVFAPHPPWRLWTAEGYARAIKLVHDDSRALVDGPAPDFEAFRARLNAQLSVNSITVGQYHAWTVQEAVKRDKRSRNGYDGETHHPYGNPGPGFYARVAAIKPSGVLVYRWIRSARRESSYRDGAYPTECRINPQDVLNVSAYTKGDYRQFYADPRTRAAYLEWAPLLLAAEDFVCGRVKREPTEEGPDRWTRKPTPTQNPEDE